MGEGLGARIKQCRLQIGKSQAELAADMGVSLNSINRFEKGHREPDVAFLIRLAEFCGCDLAWLLGVSETEGGASKGPSEGVPVLKVLPADLATASAEQAEGWLNYPGAPDDCFAVRAPDDSMLPAIKRGDFVLFRPIESAEKGDVVVLCDEWGDIRVRRLAMADSDAYYVGDHPDVPPVIASRGHHRVAGRVVRIVREMVL